MKTSNTYVVVLGLIVIAAMAGSVIAGNEIDDNTIANGAVVGLIALAAVVIGILASIAHSSTDTYTATLRYEPEQEPVKVWPTDWRKQDTEVKPDAS